MNQRRNFIKSTAAAVLLPQFLFSNNEINFQNQLSIIKPPALKIGDTVALCCPAGAVWDDSSVTNFISILKNMGFNVEAQKSLTAKHGYFAGTDIERANEINSLFGNPKIKAIFSMKGGWGCARILDKLNYELIKKNPKIILGFSDVTSLLNAITFKTGLLTFHGSSGNSSWGDFTKKSFVDVCMLKQTPNFITDEKEITVYSHGKCTGELIGGNLTVLCGIAGSTYLPSFKNKILFIEETKEEPYSIDRMLTQLKLNGTLNSINALVFGKCNKCLAEEPEKSFTLEQVFEQHFKSLSIPVISGLSVGHIENKLTLPIGSKVELDTKKMLFKMNESAVS